LDWWRNLGTARTNLGGAGTQTAGLAFGGLITGNTTAQKNTTDQLGLVVEIWEQLEDF
jgi:hypothetical protein